MALLDARLVLYMCVCTLVEHILHGSCSHNVTVAEDGVHHSAHHPHGDMPKRPRHMPLSGGGEMAAEHRNSGVTVAEGGVHHSSHHPHGDMPAEHHLGGVMVAEGGVHHSAVTMFSSHLTTTRKRLMPRSFLGSCFDNHHYCAENREKDH